MPSQNIGLYYSKQTPQGVVSNWYYVGCFFVTVASVLGTGILGLPVKTSQSGFWPFFVVFIVVLIMEEAVVAFTVELMQQSVALMDKHITSLDELKASHSKNSDTEEPSSAPSVESSSLLASQKKSYGQLTDQDDLKDKSTLYNLNLHVMGRIFLSPKMRHIFDVCVLLHFLSILISYVLAASEAWGELFGIHVNCQSEPSEHEQNNLRIVIICFGAAATGCVVFGQKLFTTFVSFFTAAKGGLLVILVGIVAYAAIDINEHISSDWKYFMDSFLMSTVALGGAVNLMPLIFNKVPQTPQDVKKYRAAVMSGLFVCGVLIVLWTFFIMKAVPQTSEDDDSPSLSSANENGCISTIPLVEILQDDEDGNSSFGWIATIVQVFIMISVTVSFIAVGSGLKNFLDGQALFFVDNIPWNTIPVIRRYNPLIIIKIFMYVFSFGSCLAIALGKPSCFLVILEYFTSMALNLENGAFIAWMLYISSQYQKTVPAPVSPGLAKYSSLAVAIFFLLAVGYTLADFLRKIVSGEQLC
mmetsp:Transcript_29296/g.41246  ORF Transcript_29296/g.41246 Transcript_29296/m.41246 type:complete len:528 (-) Transcript_29296:60-1643(-)